MNCPHCGKEVASGVKFCRFCGTAIPEVQATPQTRGIFCPQCGAPLPEGAKFCNKCGATLSASPNTAQNIPPQNVPQYPTGNMQVPQNVPQGVPQRNTPYMPNVPQRNMPPYPQMVPPPGRRTKPKSSFSVFLRVVSVILVVAILVTGLWKPGFMLPWIHQLGWFTAANPKVEYNTDTLVLNDREIDAITPVVCAVSTEETVATAGDITVDLGTLDGEHTLAIRDAGMMKDNAEDADVRVIDLRLDDGKTQPEGYVAITLPYDPSNDDPLDTITARNYDEKTKTWTILPAEFDTEAKTVTFWTNHFSKKGLYDTSASRIAMKEAVQGAIANGTVDLGPAYDEYKEDGTGFDWGGAAAGGAQGALLTPAPLNGAGALAGFIIGGKYKEWNNDEPFLYVQSDIKEGKGALCRVEFNSNRMTQIATKITTDFDTLQDVVKQQRNWQDDTTIAGKAAIAVGLFGNAGTTFDNTQQVFSSMGKLTQGTSSALSKVCFAVGVVLTVVKVGVTWYDKGSFTAALKEAESSRLSLSAADGEVRAAWECRLGDAARGQSPKQSPAQPVRVLEKTKKKPAR